MLEDLSAKSLRVMEIAGNEAVGLNRDFTGTEHILLGLLLCEDDIVAPLLAKHGIDVEEVRASVAGATRADPGESQHVRTLTARAKQVLTLAAREADALGHDELEPPHLLLGILRQETGLAALVLRDKGVDLAELRVEVLQSISLVEASAQPVPAAEDDASIVGAVGEAVAADETPVEIEVVPPTCPVCAKPLSEVLAVTTITPVGSASSGRRRSVPGVSIVYCGACGHTLSAVR